jgi:enamine deaminase RidA (YjgF/YER057c/UK114 family)
MTDTTASARLAELGIELPPLPVPGGCYVPWTRAGDTVFMAGIASPSTVGRLGETVDMELGRRAAEGCALLQLAAIADALGSLDRVEQVLRMTGFVACTPEFTSVPAVVDGASELFLRVFGTRGRHARSAIGVTALPGGAAVEVEIVVLATGPSAAG